tara:strand:+ start:159 stop:818 length:660 start_codon:yes stop_codon:yes gene_type:complete
MLDKENKSIILYFKESYISEALSTRLAKKKIKVISAKNLNAKLLHNKDLIIIDENKEKISSALSKLDQHKYSGLIVGVLNESNSINENRKFIQKFNKFLVKPIRITELCEVLLSLLDNTDKNSLYFNRLSKLLEFSNEKFDTIKLTEKEIALAKRLLKDEGRIVSRTKLLSDVWGYNELVTTKTLDTHIHRLRSKFARIPNSPKLYTAPGGYKLKLPAS